MSCAAAAGSDILSVSCTIGTFPGSFFLQSWALHQPQMIEQVYIAFHCTVLMSTTVDLLGYLL